MTDSPPPLSLAAQKTGSVIPRIVFADPDGFLKKISVKNPAGLSLRYDLLYDEVRLSRQEDDPRLSMGVWKTDLKRADWPKIESLCAEALMSRTKDLQIAAWLTEAWICLDGIEGYLRGINMVSGLCKNFWGMIHPQPQEGEDMESRYMIFEWMDATLSTRLLNIPLTKSSVNQNAIGLGFLKSAQHMDASEKRIDKSAKAASKVDPSKITGSVQDFQKELAQTSYDFLIQQNENVLKASLATQDFKDILTTLCGTQAPSFTALLKTLKEMSHVLTTALQNREPPVIATQPAAGESLAEDSAALTLPPVSTTPAIQPSTLSNNSHITTRQEAYRHLELIAAFLEKNDPHSPAHQLIRQLIRWENQNILDIFGEIAQSPQDLSILMKLLGASAPKT